MSGGRITLVLGGARSGKSRLAEQRAERRWQRPLYLAAAEAVDAEMVARIAAHRDRRGGRWRCIEEPLDLARALRQGEPSCDGVLVECITVWLGNVMVKETEEAFARRRADLLAALEDRSRDVILVSNEVGLGVVPPSELGRRFRDLAGWLNQDLARIADDVVFVAAGLPLWMKGSET